MIRISLGNVGSGKTANEVREMYINKAKRKTYSNIKCKLKHVIPLKHEFIVNKTMIDTKKKKDGTVEPIYELKLNQDYWKNIKEPINVVLDEVHSIVNARRSMSKVNIIVTDWLALIRRVLGQSEAGYGELVLISQLPNRIDIIAREMATQIRYHICHYTKTCSNCRTSWKEHSEVPEGLWICFQCGSPRIKKHHHKIEIYHFQSMQHFEAWKDFGQQSYYKHYMVNDIEMYFPLYDTLQWDNMFSDLY